MLSFLLGLTAAGAVLNNRQGVARGLATLIVKGQDVAVAVGREVQRMAEQTSEDLQDIVAEARAEHLAETRDAPEHG